MTTCQRCGACCAHFRVSFYWAEAEALGLPAESTRQLGKLLACLAGTDQPQPRCHLLQGEVGREVTCSCYAQRPSPCRELQPGDEKCNRARAAHGLPLLLAQNEIRAVTPVSDEADPSPIAAEAHFSPAVPRV